MCQRMCSIRQGKNNNKVNLPLNMVWAVKRDHLVGDITPLAGMPSSLVEEARVSLEWSSITGPARSEMLQKIEDNKHKNMSAQRTSRGAPKVWRLLHY